MTNPVLTDNEKLVPDWSRNIKIISRTDRTKDQIKILLGPDERSEEGLIEFLFGPEWDQKGNNFYIPRPGGD